MTTDHKELCERLRACWYAQSPLIADVIVLIQQQAARIAELEKERDALKVE